MSRTRVLTLLLAGCMIIAYAYTGFAYFQERQKQQTISEQINNASSALQLIPKPAADLKQRFADAQQSSARTRESIFPSSINTTEYINNIFGLADENQVKVTLLTTDPWAERKVDERTFSALSISLQVEGTPVHLVAFIMQTEERIPSLVVDSLSVERNDDSADISLTGTLDLAVYTLPAGNE